MPLHSHTQCSYRVSHEAVESAQQGTVRALMSKLSDACAPMKTAVAALAHLDCLMSLSHTQVRAPQFVFAPLTMYCTHSGYLVALHASQSLSQRGRAETAVLSTSKT